MRHLGQVGLASVGFGSLSVVFGSASVGCVSALAGFGSASVGEGSVLFRFLHRSAAGLLAGWSDSPHEGKLCRELEYCGCAKSDPKMLKNII